LGDKKEMNLSINLAPHNRYGLKLVNPVMLASGTCGYGTEENLPIDINKLGAIVVKGTTLKPKEGNPQPRLAETEQGLINCIGLQNIGVEAVLKEQSSKWGKLKVPVIVNIAGSTVEEYAAVAAKLNGAEGVSALEINISCPNVGRGCLEFGANPQMAAEVTKAVRKVTTLPLIVKLTPNTASISEVALAVEKAGADAVSLINTFKAMKIDITKRRPLLGNISGGLSGPAIKPIALCMVYEVAASVKIPVIGCGGISGTTDALEFIMAGASAIQIGTAYLTNPQTPLEVITGIEEFMAAEGIADIKDIIGIARS
jgi:dihydroorotate dehydrogenase (NAD+) catalytic subunit